MLLEVLAFIDHEEIKRVRKLRAQFDEAPSQRLERIGRSEVDWGLSRLRDREPRQLVKRRHAGRIRRQALHGIGERTIEADVEGGLAVRMCPLQRTQGELRLARPSRTHDAKPPGGHFHPAGPDREAARQVRGDLTRGAAQQADVGGCSHLLREEALDPRQVVQIGVRHLRRLYFEQLLDDRDELIVAVAVNDTGGVDRGGQRSGQRCRREVQEVVDIQRAARVPA